MCGCTCTQGVESVFDIMDMEDDSRNNLLKFSDTQMQVRTLHQWCTCHVWLYYVQCNFQSSYYNFFGCVHRTLPGFVTATLT